MAYSVRSSGEQYFSFKYQKLNRNENSFYLYCEDCREDILNDDEYEIIKINDNQKEQLIIESQELIDKLNKQLKRLYELQEIKCETDKFPYDELSDLNYNCYVHGQKSFVNKTS